MTGTSTKAKSQIHMDDVVIQDDELLQMLEDREEAKKAAAKKKIKLKSPKWYNAVDGFWVEWLRARNLISIPSVKYTEYKK